MDRRLQQSDSDCESIKQTNLRKIYQAPAQIYPKSSPHLNFVAPAGRRRHKNPQGQVTSKRNPQCSCGHCDKSRLDAGKFRDGGRAEQNSVRKFAYREMII
jgi:hypothetical protein